MKDQLRKHISHWAFLPLDQFKDDDSLREKRIDFGVISKIAMVVDCTDSQDIPWSDDEVAVLDSVNDFERFFREKGLKVVNEPYLRESAM